MEIDGKSLEIIEKSLEIHRKSLKTYRKHVIGKKVLPGILVSQGGVLQLCALQLYRKKKK